MLALDFMCRGPFRRIISFCRTSKGTQYRSKVIDPVICSKYRFSLMGPEHDLLWL